MFVGGRVFILYYIYNILHTNTVNCTQNISSRSFRILFNMHENAAKRSLVCVWWKSYGSEIRRENPVDMENLPFFTTGFITSSGGWEYFLFLSLDGTFWHLNVLLMKVWINVGHFFRKLTKFITILKKTLEVVSTQKKNKKPSNRRCVPHHVWLRDLPMPSHLRGSKQPTSAI